MVLKNERYRDDLILGNVLVDMYVKCGRINEVRFIFESMLCRNVIIEIFMVSGYAKVVSVDVVNLLFMKMMDRNIVFWNVFMVGYI